MSPPGSPPIEFWFEQSGSETQVMRGLAAAVVFSEARDFAHALRIGKRQTGTASGVERWQLEAASSPAPADQGLNGRRIENPVYQGLVPLPREAHGIGALLTGSCFDHHFAAVFSLGRDRDAPGFTRLEIDVADRCRGEVEKLAATYLVTRADAVIETTSVTAQSVTWALNGGVLELIAIAPAIIGLPSNSGEGMRVQIQAIIDPQTHTQRLHYCWRWAT
jgi:hypothetical protein